MIKVMIADDHPLIRHGLKRILSEGDEINVLDEAGSVMELRRKLRDAKLDALILDISMPGVSGLEGLKEIKQDYPGLPVLILSIHPEDQYAIRALKAGAAGYLNKECAPEQLVNAVKKIADGERYVTAKVGDLLASQLHENTDRPLHEQLSDRELQVLLLIASGRTLTEIGKSFNLSVKTVSTYRNRILKKMNMKSNAEMVKYVIAAGLPTS